MNCDWDSEFDFRWDGPSSICDWTGKVLILAFCGTLTCIDYAFCCRWRTHFYPPIGTAYGSSASKAKGRKFWKKKEPEPVTAETALGVTLPVELTPTDTKEPKEKAKTDQNQKVHDQRDCG